MKKKLVMAAVLGLLGLLSWYLGGLVSPGQIQTALEGLGVWAPLAYVGLFAVLPAFFFRWRCWPWRGDCFSACGRARYIPSSARCSIAR